MLHAKHLFSKGLIKDKKMLTQSQIAQVKFVAKLDNIKLFYNSLKAVNFNEDVTIVISSDGLKAVVEDAKYVQAVVFVSHECFSEYSLQTDAEITLRVNLNVLCDCLSIFTGADSSMQIIYKGDGAPLVLVLEQHGEESLVTECSIKTKSPEEIMDFVLDEDDAGFNKIIVRGPDFAQLLADINRDTGELEIYMAPKPPYFRLTMLGVTQSESEVEVAHTSDMMIRFSCKTSSSVRYKMSHVRVPMKAMSLATKVAVRTDSSGLLALQMMEATKQIFIEYFITPLIDDLD